MTTLNISDDSGFLGLANLSKYDSFIDYNWDFEMLKKRIVDQMNQNNILFWSTGRGDNWKVQLSINDKLQNKDFHRVEKALINVTNERIYLVNYETLSMAAQFEDTKLPEHYLANLYFELKNGLYLVEFGQLTDPEKYEKGANSDFEIRFELISEPDEYYSNNFGNIIWNEY